MYTKQTKRLKFFSYFSARWAFVWNWPVTTRNFRLRHTFVRAVNFTKNLDLESCRFVLTVLAYVTVFDLLVYYITLAVRLIYNILCNLYAGVILRTSSVFSSVFNNRKFKVKTKLKHLLNQGSFLPVIQSQNLHSSYH